MECDPVSAEAAWQECTTGCVAGGYDTTRERAELACENIAGADV